MKIQNYQNHKRYYLPHHIFFYSAIILLFLASMYYCVTASHDQLLWLFMGLAFVLIGLLSYMLRQHYALGNQNRIVRLEMRFRYYVLTHQRFEPVEVQLSLSQLLALRFASDEELLPLIERTLKEDLSPDAIKRAVNNWQADHLRV